MSKTAIELARLAAAGHPPPTTPVEPSAAPTKTQSAATTPAPAAVIAITMPADLGRLVRTARKNRRLSQQAFADLAGVGRRFLSELENGKATLEIGKVLRVIAACGIDLTAQVRR